MFAFYVALPSTNNKNFVANVVRHLKDHHLSKNAINFTREDPDWWSFAEDSLKALVVDNKAARGRDMFDALRIMSRKNVPLNFFEGANEEDKTCIKPISARTMARNLQLLADSIRTCNVLFFDNVASICLAFDGWSTMRGKKSFIGIVCHWIDNNFQRNSALIGFVPEI